MRLILTLWMIALLPIACGNKEQVSKDAKPTPVSVSSEDAALRQASAKLIDSFSRNLKTELMAALNKGGAVAAIQICQIRAPQIAASHSSEHWAVKRVTDRNRSPKNLASGHETDILAKFSDTSLIFFDEWTDDDTSRVYHYYRPIFISQLCLKCHGTQTDVDSKIKPLLREKYPHDMAVGYNSGDLRGMFVVEVDGAYAAEFVRKISRDSL